MAKTIDKKDDGQDLLGPEARAALRGFAADVALYPALSEDERMDLYKKAYAKDAEGKTRNAQELARAMHLVREVKDYLDLVLKYVNAAHDTLRIDLLPGQMETEGLEGFKLEGVGRISLTGDLYVKIAPGQDSKLHAWLKKHKLGDLVKPGINPSTLKAFVKGRIESGKEVPTELDVTPYTRASITKKDN